MQNTKDFVSVNVRLKPIRSRKSFKTSLKILSQEPPVLFLIEKNQTFNFDKIFTGESSNAQIYVETVKNLVEKVKEGYNSTIFAYGQTGTGKTYTMGMNPSEGDAGIVPRALEDFFSLNLDENCENYDISEYDVHVSFLEIYNEKVFDLLNNQCNTPLPKGRNDGLIVQRVFNVFEAKHLLEIGGKNRHTGETKQNVFSSRSHAIFTIHFTAKIGEKRVSSKLNLVDLAGSEGVKKTGTFGNSFVEGVNINKGLLCIGQVMKALSENSSFIPYRQSIITTILQDSLNRNNYISLIACVRTGIEDSNETLQTLEFAQRVKKMKNNKPEINEIVTKFRNENRELFEKATPIPIATPSRKILKENFFKTPKIPPAAAPTGAFSMDFSKLSSTSSFQNETGSNCNNFSPVLRKYMSEFEEKITEKLQTVIRNTVKRRSSDWGRIEEKVSNLIREEIVQQTAKRAASSPIDYDKENAKKILEYNSPVLEEIFKKPKLGRPKKAQTNTRKSARLSMKTTEYFPRRSIRLSMKLYTSATEKSVKVLSEKKKNSSSESRNDQILNVLNNGDVKQLKKLPTIGPKTAERILLFRSLHGPFKAVKDLAEMPDWSTTLYRKFLNQNCIKI